VSGFSAAAGRRNRQVNRRGNFGDEVSYELHGIGHKVKGALRLHAIESDSFRPRARSRESEFYRDEHEDEDDDEVCTL
jgi:hypothetical protein